MVWRRIFIWIKIVLMLTLWQEGKKQNTSQKTKHWIPLTKHALQLGGTGSLMKKGVALVPQKPSTSTPFTQRRTLAHVHMHPHPFKLPDHPCVRTYITYAVWCQQKVSFRWGYVCWGFQEAAVHLFSFCWLGICFFPHIYILPDIWAHRLELSGKPKVSSHLRQAWAADRKHAVCTCDIMVYFQ